MFMNNKTNFFTIFMFKKIDKVVWGVTPPIPFCDAN